MILLIIITISYSYIYFNQSDDCLKNDKLVVQFNLLFLFLFVNIIGLIVIWYSEFSSYFAILLNLALLVMIIIFSTTFLKCDADNKTLSIVNIILTLCCTCVAFLALQKVRTKLTQVPSFTRDFIKNINFRRKNEVYLGEPYEYDEEYVNISPKKTNNTINELETEEDEDEFQDAVESNGQELDNNPPLNTPINNYDANPYLLDVPLQEVQPIDTRNVFDIELYRRPIVDFNVKEKIKDESYDTLYNSVFANVDEDVTALRALKLKSFVNQGLSNYDQTLVKDLENNIVKGTNANTIDDLNSFIFSDSFTNNLKNFEREINTKKAANLLVNNVSAIKNVIKPAAQYIGGVATGIYDIATSSNN